MLPSKIFSFQNLSDEVSKSGASWIAALCKAIIGLWLKLMKSTSIEKMKKGGIPLGEYVKKPNLLGN